MNLSKDLEEAIRLVGIRPVVNLIAETVEKLTRVGAEVRMQNATNVLEHEELILIASNLRRDLY